MTHTPSGPSGPRRRPRRDAEANRERILTAAAAAITREGHHVPLATIAAEAGVGIGTLYRKYADREALLQALGYRAYGLLNQILDEIEASELSGLQVVIDYASRALTIADQLVLPLQGAPPLMSAEAVKAREAISSRLEEFIARGHADGSIRARINATDVIVFTTFVSRPLAHGPNWPQLAERQLAIFANGLASSGPAGIPGPAITRQDIEATFSEATSSHKHSASNDVSPAP
jgi:AcrR family transcriptional regulator